METERFQKLKVGQIFLFKIGYPRKRDRLAVLVTGVDYKFEVCELVVCEIEDVGKRWKVRNIFTKTHNNQSRYAAEQWLEFDRWESLSKLELLLESGRSVESFMREGIHVSVKSHSENLHSVRVRTKTAKENLYKGIRALSHENCSNR